MGLKKINYTVIAQEVENEIKDKFTKAQTNSLLSGKANAAHIHAESDISNLDKYTKAEVNALIGAKQSSNQKGQPLGYAGLDAGSKIPLSQLPDIAKQQTYVVADQAALNALTPTISGERAYVLASGNSYIWNGSVWKIVAKADWENVNLDWANISNKPASTQAQIDDSVSKLHTHSNKAILDGTQESFTTVLKNKIDSVGGTISHTSLTNRTSADAHPSTAITFDKTGTTLVATTVQAALLELLQNTLIIP